MPPRVERGNEAISTSEQVEQEIAADLQTAAKEALRLIERAKATGNSGVLDRIANRTGSLTRRLWMIGSILSLTRAEGVKIDYPAVHETRSADGTVEYTHTDLTTTHILNVITGKERPTEDEMIAFYRSEVAQEMQRKGVIQPENFAALDREGLQQLVRTGLFGDKNALQAKKRSSQTFKEPDLKATDAFDQRYYDVAWGLERERRSPDSLGSRHAIIQSVGL